MFTVVMPYYKKASVVKRSIDSVLDQTYSDFELVIVDDGSEDNIEEIVNGYGDPRIKLLKQENHGVSVARNNAIQHANFDWICFLDSDDTWEINHLMLLEEMIKEKKGIKFFVTSYKRLGANLFESNTLFPKDYPNTFITNNFLELINMCGPVIHTNSICVHKSLFEKYGLFREGLNIGEDTDLWYRFSLYVDVCITKTITSNYYRDASTLTADTFFSFDWPFAHDFVYLDKNIIPYERVKSHSVLVNNYLLSECKNLISEGKKNKAYDIFSNVIKDCPRALDKKKTLVKLLLMMPEKLAAFVCKADEKNKMKRL
jgi:glycosyltransferase involved in cell wall biosynthesis